MYRFLLICLGGAIGTGARYLIAIGAPRLLGTSFTLDDAARELGVTTATVQRWLKEGLLAGTGRTDWPTTPARGAWLACGRRAGKSRVAAVVAVYLAAFRD